jgi:hypothetical protein
MGCAGGHSVARSMLIVVASRIEPGSVERLEIDE